MTSEEIMTCVRAAFNAERFAQAYVIIGPPRGEGRDVADRILELLFCDTPGQACGVCRGCVTAREHTHPDLAWIEPQKRSRIISIDQVRALQARIYQTSFQAGWKACVMVTADRLNEAAANAFLKTLEEPPPRSVFLLLTDAPQFLLPTIQSRCQQITVSTAQSGLPPECEAALLEILMQRPGTGGVITAFARSDRIAALLKQVKDAALAEEKERAAAGALDESDETLDARANARYREVRTGVMRAVLLWYRDLFILHCGGEPEFIHHRRAEAVLRERAARLSYAQAWCNIGAVEEMNRRFERNMPESYVLGAGFFRLIG